MDGLDPFGRFKVGIDTNWPNLASVPAYGRRVLDDFLGEYGQF